MAFAAALLYLLGVVLLVLAGLGIVPGRGADARRSAAGRCVAALGGDMNTLVGAAEPPEQQPAWSISYLQAKCPYTGVSVWMGCRGPCCRPDLHVLSAQQRVAYAPP